jgi:hypothetical protein
MDHVQRLDDVLASDRVKAARWREQNPWPLAVEKGGS